ncbi:MAG: hypothetical protein GEU88_09145 [Solirubrobacterales bacterium]|nr:hypothetical protein [Solirubrobacterales bacterium]
MDRQKVAGVLGTVCGALIVIALLLNWWGYPAAFDHPEDLPRAAAFSAEQAASSGREPHLDAFEFFKVRDLVWLAAGVVGFAFGLIALTRARIATLVTAAVGALALVAALLIALTLISPPDYADPGPESVKPFDFGVDLPLSAQPGAFVALAAAWGLVISVGVALVEGERRRRRAGHP